MPLMQNVLADLELEAQVSTAMMTRVAATFDHAGENEQERLLNASSHRSPSTGSRSGAPR